MVDVDKIVVVGDRSEKNTRRVGCRYQRTWQPQSGILFKAISGLSEPVVTLIWSIGGGRCEGCEIWRRVRGQLTRPKLPKCTSQDRSPGWSGSDCDGAGETVRLLTSLAPLSSPGSALLGQTSLGSFLFRKKLAKNFLFYQFKRWFSRLKCCWLFLILIL